LGCGWDGADFAHVDFVVQFACIDWLWSARPRLGEKSDVDGQPLKGLSDLKNLRYR
jgi:hypothetical protein